MNYLSHEEHQRRLKVYKKGGKDCMAAKELGMTEAGYGKWRKRHGLPRHKAPRQAKIIKPEKPKQDPTPFYQPSPDAHIYKRILRAMFMPTPESAIGLPGVNVRTKIRYVDRAI